MGTSDMSDGQPFEKKAINAVVEELERQAAENPEKINVKRTCETVTVNGEIDVDGTPRPDNVIAAMRRRTMPYLFWTSTSLSERPQVLLPDPQSLSIPRRRPLPLDAPVTAVFQI